ncbi:hypothetical protein [Pseudomonas putida]|jgi:hypothetical protein|nr:hypothetical protein [Pseudomonas putida]
MSEVKHADGRKGCAAASQVILMSEVGQSLLIALMNTLAWGRPARAPKR